MTINAGTVLLVKKMMCHLLIVWLTLMSVGANAHVTSDAAHEVLYTQDQAVHETQNHTTIFDAVTTADSSHADICNQSHCGHGHTAGMLTRHGTCVKTDTVTTVPTSRASWASSTITSNIERPKWPVTTPAVVNLLSLRTSI